jgi:general secretion pathway protein C
MPARLSAIDRGRLSARAAMATCVVLAALALWLFVRLVWSLLPRGDLAADLPSRAASVTAGPAPAQSIARWHLFGAAPAVAAAGEGAPAAALGLILRGTLADPDPAAGVAVISAPQAGERSFRVGDEVAGGRRLAAVYADHVVLTHAGAEETLTLPRDTNPAPADIVRPTPATASSRGAPVQATAAPSAARQALQQLRQDPRTLMQNVQVVPVLEGGRLAGVRLSATGPEAGLMARAGLRAGDVVTRINGRAVASIAPGEDLLASLGSAGSVRVTVLREGKPVDLTVALH